METLISNTASTLALTAAGVFFMTGLITGYWKYQCMRRHPQAEAPFYVHTAHRAALMYAFAAQLLAVFAALSKLPAWLNILGVTAPILFFGMAILHYVKLGQTTTSNNSLRDAEDKTKAYQILDALAIAEIGGFSILFIGFLLRLLGQ